MNLHFRQDVVSQKQQLHFHIIIASLEERLRWNDLGLSLISIFFSKE
jgi:hypothetical protein